MHLIVASRDGHHGMRGAGVLAPGLRHNLSQNASHEHFRGHPSPPERLLQLGQTVPTLDTIEDLFGVLNPLVGGSRSYPHKPLIAVDHVPEFMKFTIEGDLFDFELVVDVARSGMNQPQINPKRTERLSRCRCSLSNARRSFADQAFSALALATRYGSSGAFQQPQFVELLDQVASRWTTIDDVFGDQPLENRIDSQIQIAAEFIQSRWGSTQLG